MKKLYQTPRTMCTELTVESVMLTTSLPINDSNTQKMLSGQREVTNSFDEMEED